MCDDTDNNLPNYLDGTGGELSSYGSGQGNCPQGSNGKRVVAQAKTYDLTHLRLLNVYEFAATFCWGKVKGQMVITAWRDLFATSTKTSWPWEFRGNNYVRGLGVGTTDGTAEASGKYESCLSKWGCINSDNLVITIHARPGGTWSFDVRKA